MLSACAEPVIHPTDGGISMYGLWAPRTHLSELHGVLSMFFPQADLCPIMDFSAMNGQEAGRFSVKPAPPDPRIHGLVLLFDEDHDRMSDRQFCRILHATRNYALPLNDERWRDRDEPYVPSALWLPTECMGELRAATCLLGINWSKFLRQDGIRYCPRSEVMAADTSRDLPGFIFRYNIVHCPNARYAVRAFSDVMIPLSDD